MSIVSLLPFPVILGSAQATPLAPSGTVAKATTSRNTPAGELDGIPVQRAGSFEAVEGVPTAPGHYLVPAIVVSALRELGHTPAPGVCLYTPAPLKEEGGVKFAPHLLLQMEG